MRYILKPLAYMFTAIALIIFFMPKINMYYKAEELLENYKLTISGEKVVDDGFIFKVEDGTLYFDDLVVANFDEISIVPLVFYNSVDVKPFSLSDDMRQFIPLKVNNINITQTVVNPLHVKIDARGEFGSVSGDIDILNSKISLILMPSKLLLKKRPFWLRQMKKDSQGGYRYESTY